MEDEAERGSTLLMLEEHVLRLDQMSHIVEQPAQRVTHSKLALLHALCAAMNLRNRSKLAETLRLTLGCVPGVLEGLGLGDGLVALPTLPGASK